MARIGSPGASSQMTTIAANQKVMAADTRTVTGETWFRTSKIVRVGRSVVGVAGDSSAIEKFLRWYIGGRKKRERPEFRDSESFAALILDSRGMWHCDESLAFDRVNDDYFAIGTGAIAALVAMDLGLDPVAAVEAACRRDANSGLPVEHMER